MSFYNEKDFKDLKQGDKQRIEDLTLFQRDAYIQSLKTLSKQNVVYLNPLGKNAYHIAAGFTER